MDKQATLQSLKQLIAAKQVTRSEILELFAKQQSSRLDLPKIFGYLGALIVFIGLGLFAAINWQDFNSVAKILVTLGMAIAFYISGVWAYQDSRAKEVSSWLFFISAILFPTGLNVTFNQLQVPLAEATSQVILSGLLLMLMGFSFWLYRQQIFVIMLILASTWLFVSLTDLVVRQVLVLPAGEGDLFMYRNLVIGSSYIATAAYLQRHYLLLSQWLRNLGLLVVLISGLWLTGLVWWDDQVNLVWLIVYPLLPLAAVVASTRMQSKTFISLGTLGLIAYISALTTEYFADSFGWPIVLIIIGLVTMSISYLAYHTFSHHIVE